MAEKDYSKSHRLSKVKAKAIRNSMNLINSDNFEAEKKLQKITPLLTDRETNWDDQHKMKLKLSVIKKIENGRKKRITLKQCWLSVSHGVDFVHLLMDCN